MNEHMQYMGACALLGRLSARIKDEDDLESIHRAMLDCAATTDGRFEVVRAGERGWSLEPVKDAPTQTEAFAPLLPDKGVVAALEDCYAFARRSKRMTKGLAGERGWDQIIQFCDRGGCQSSPLRDGA